MAERRMHKEKTSLPAGLVSFLALPFIVTVTCKTDYSVCPPRPAPTGRRHLQETGV